VPSLEIPRAIVVEVWGSLSFVAPATAPATGAIDCMGISVGARKLAAAGAMELLAASVALVALGTIVDADPTRPFSTGVDCSATEVTEFATTGAMELLAPSVALVALGTIVDVELIALLSTGVVDCSATEVTELATTGAMEEAPAASVALLALGTIVDAEPTAALPTAGTSVATVAMEFPTVEVTDGREGEVTIEVTGGSTVGPRFSSPALAADVTPLELLGLVTASIALVGPEGEALAFDATGGGSVVLSVTVPALVAAAALEPTVVTLERATIEAVADRAPTDPTVDCDTRPGVDADADADRSNAMPTATQNATANKTPYRKHLAVRRGTRSSTDLLRTREDRSQTQTQSALKSSCVHQNRLHAISRTF
jgi:hypothetical protein